MPSSKGKPTDPKLREEVKEDVKKQSKGGGPGNCSAYKAAEMAREYEKRGGQYSDTGDNPNSSEKGQPKPKKEAVEKEERKDPKAPVGAKKTATKKDDSKKTKSSAQKTKKELSKPASRAQPKRGKKKET